MQFAVYRGIGLEGWYHILSAGYRFPAIGASDYPYCRALGDCRTYVKLDTAQPTMADYNRALAEGRSFFTTGPLVEFKVDGKQAGEELELAKGATVKVQAKVTSLVADVQELQIIEGGTVRFRKTVNKDEQRKPIRWSLDLPIQRSTWIAFRAIAPGPDEREDVEAHTNPVFISVGDKPRIKSESIRWLLAKLDERIRIHESRKFAEKPKVLAYFAESRKRLLERLEQAE